MVTQVTVLSEEHDINTTIDCNDDVFILELKNKVLNYLTHVVQVHVQRVLVK
jgi:hypothetical protein